MMLQAPVEFLEQQPEDRSSWFPTHNYMSGRKACHEQDEVKIKVKLEIVRRRRKKPELFGWQRLLNIETFFYKNLLYGLCKMGYVH